MDDPKGIWFRDENALRDAVLELSTEIRGDVNRMADLIREMVDLERIKRGLDDPTGSLVLKPNPDRSSSRSPDAIGTGTVAGRHYRAAAWITHSTIRIGLELRRSLSDARG